MCPFPDEKFGVNQVTFEYGVEEDTITYRNASGLAINGPEGCPIEDQNGVAIYRMEYDFDLGVKRTFYYDARGELTLDDQGVAMLKELIYPQTNEREVAHYGLQLNPNYLHLSDQQIKYDEKYLLINDCKGVGVIRYVYDASGNLLEKRIFDKNRQITHDENGVFLYRQTFNKQGLVICRESFSSFTRAVEDSKGISRYEYNYDEKGNCLEQRQYGLDNKLKKDPSGVAIYQWTYNAHGLPIRQKNLGVYAQLKENSDGVAIYEWSYNRAGDKVEQVNYGSDAKVLEDKTGIPAEKILVEDQALNTYENAFYSLALLKEKNLKTCLLGEFSQLVKPAERITPFIEDLTGITNDMVERAPDFSCVGEQFREWVASYTPSLKKIRLVAWGAYFDGPLLRRVYEAYEMPFPFSGTIIDVKSIAISVWALLGKRTDQLDLCSCAKTLGISSSKQVHRALADAQLTTEVLIKLWQYLRHRTPSLKEKGDINLMEGTSK
ncbi:UNVERIFIED_CONTAM: hypothetical protein PYX00_010938 [Menopon gallinae]|uniref:Exonuclease domain-containing protein n=1 Tax=Menopon gallinae TaxID=328185 RepID=A0AAW2H6W0_9NEOP